MCACVSVSVCDCCVSQLSCNKKKQPHFRYMNCISRGVYYFLMCVKMQDTSVCILPIPVARCKSLQKFEFEKWHKWKLTLKINLDHVLYSCFIWVFAWVHIEPQWLHFGGLVFKSHWESVISATMLYKTTWAILSFGEGSCNDQYKQEEGLQHVFTVQSRVGVCHLYHLR